MPLDRRQRQGQRQQPQNRPRGFRADNVNGIVRCEVGLNLKSPGGIVVQDRDMGVRRARLVGHDDQDEKVLKVVSYCIMYWYMCLLDASHHCLVFNKDCRLSPSTSQSSSWFLLLAYIAPVVGIHRTRRLAYLSLAYIALAVRIHRTILLLIESKEGRQAVRRVRWARREGIRYQSVRQLLSSQGQAHDL